MNLHEQVHTLEYGFGEDHIFVVVRLLFREQHHHTLTIFVLSYCMKYTSNTHNTLTKIIS